MTVYLLGAGPGDPDLLTVRGAEVLRRAQCVVYDRLAAPALLTLVPDDAERIYVGKGPGFAEMTQAEINAVLVARGTQYDEVVRLKGGDPYIFGRGGEEADELRRAGVAFEVIPGITSAIAAAAYAGIPVTHRGLSTHVTIVTGHEDPAKGRTDVDWEALARVGGTLVILMGVGHIRAIADRLMAGGLAPDTPVAAVRNGTRPDQRTIRTTLAAAADAGFASPSAIIVGAVAALDYAWFEQRPLFGRRIVVTRAREQASELRTALEALGAEVLELPAITIVPNAFALPDLKSFDWLVCTSANGVAALFDRGIRPAGLDARALAGMHIAAIGPGTAAAFAERGITVDLVPDRFVAESLLSAFPDGPGRVLLARAEQARDVLPEGLRAKDWEVEVLSVYRTETAAPDPAALAAVQSGAVDCITFTSSSTVINACAAVGTWPVPAPLVASIGPVTSATARAQGLHVDVEADPHTIEGLVAAVVKCIADNPV
ncbi:MAG: uroporphyrinogen-III C-methyltransferase [Acidimicrobiia bacterium]